MFARDGFEAARLEDIASAAGYTRGAFYANFEDKEDIFFALLEAVDRRANRGSECAAAQSTTRHPSRQASHVAPHYAQFAKDRRLALLSLEFKLFAIRHPDAHARLRTRKRRLRAHGVDLIREITRSRVRSSHAPAERRALPVSAKAATAALGALSNALLLEHVVDPRTMTEADVRRLLGAFFDTVLAGSSVV